MFEEQQQAREIPDKDQPVKTQTILVNTNTIREKEKTKYLQEFDIDRIVMQETPEEQKNLRSTLPLTETNWKRKENTFKVGKLDLTKIEQRTKEFQLMADESQIHTKKTEVLPYAGFI